MPDYTTLNAQVELFKDKIDALTAQTLDANDLVLIASALDTLARSLGVNDILAATNDRIAAVDTAKNAAIAEINNSVNGNRLTALETSNTTQETRLATVENYVNTNQGNLSSLTSTVTALDAAFGPNVMRTPVVVTDNYTALSKDRLLVVPKTDGTLVITLPAIVAQGDRIQFIDVTGTAETNNYRIARNGSNIQSLSEDLIVNASGASFELVYYNSTYGWRIA